MKLIKTIKILAACGLVISVYLLWQQMYRPAFQPCTINATVNCDAIISGPVAKTLGIPTPLYGFIGYLVILYAAFFGKRNLLLATTIFGVGFCLWIAFIEIVQLRVLCPVCVACQVIMLAILVLALRLRKGIQWEKSK